MIKTTGINETERFLKNYVKKVDMIVSHSLLQSGKDLLDESKRITPEDTGELKRQTDVVRDGDDVLVRYNTDYSLYVHEDLEKRHNNGQSKFLETATNENAHKVFNNIARYIRRVR